MGPGLVEGDVRETAAGGFSFGIGHPMGSEGTGRYTGVGRCFVAIYVDFEEMN